MLRRVTDAASEPVSLADLQEHLRVGSLSDDQGLVESIGKVARQYAEEFTNRAYLKQTWRLTLDEFPRGDTITLNRSPIYSSTGVVVSYQKSTDAGSTSRTTFGSSQWSVDTESEPARVRLRHGKSWPTDRLSRTGGVRVDFEAGYETANAVPHQAKHAIKLMAGHWYENREMTVVGHTSHEIPWTARSLLLNHRVPRVP